MNYHVGKMGLSQAEQNCILCVHIFSCLYCTVHLPGASLASVVTTNHRRVSSYLICSDWSISWLMMMEEEEENCHLLTTSPRVTKGPW